MKGQEGVNGTLTDQGPTPSSLSFPLAVVPEGRTEVLTRVRARCGLQEQRPLSECPLLLLYLY